MEIKRALATIRRVGTISPIPEADRIVAVQIDGWTVVAQKGLYKEGDLAVYFEIDSFIPHELAPFLTKPGRKPDTFNGIEGQRLRTVRLKGQISQGLLLPMSEVFKKMGDMWVHTSMDGTYLVDEDDDVTNLLNVQKWEKPLPAQLAGKVRGNFPSFIPKTDQERIQNYRKILRKFADKIGKTELEFEVTEKLDGSSCTVYYYDGRVGVCSRNFDLDETQENAYWETIKRKGIDKKLINFGRNIALQGELIGPGIQKNPYGLTRTDFYMFDIFDIDAVRYLTADERISLNFFEFENNINHVHQIGFDVIKPFDENVIDDILARADGFSSFARITNSNTKREGLVFKSVDDPSISFKAISNAWLLEND